jgi:hypothetical protein
MGLASESGSAAIVPQIEPSRIPLTEFGADA